jgi:demethylmenaquinone methyltransferase / 2-methoxy-6-polyprenyl-1,4-benzoquinol methylase
MADLRAPPERDVRTMFDGLVDRYDLLNDVLSLGLDRYWRRATRRALGPRPGRLILDLGCGTGDLGRPLAAGATVVGVDLSHPMLLRARAKAGPPGRARWVEGTAFRLPFRDGAFEGALSGFVLRNLRDLPAAFEELARVIRPGGRVAMVDVTGPTRPALRRGFDAYFGVITPLAGRLVGKEREYRYLVRSLGHLPPAADVCAMLGRAGFVGAGARPLTGGVVTLFTGTRAGGAA